MPSQLTTNPPSSLLRRFSFKEEACQSFPLFSVASSTNAFRSKDDDVSMVDASSIVEVGSVLSMSTTATTAHKDEGSTSIGGGGGGDLSIMQRPSSSMRYKGVVLQQNGHWGAQIYAHHHRIWLGTFKSELAAAAAYDSAAIKLHRGDSHRNIPWNEYTIHEPRFQERFSTEVVLEMIKDGLYESRFVEYLRVMQLPQASLTAPLRGSPCSGIGTDSDGGDGSIICYEMFSKELTPSDVGKLNRLVIPKKYATRFFPEVSPESDEELLLEFRDPGSRLWVFRYCYWKSSQSYVFTKGWNKFVKEKRLQAMDSVTFYRCEERESLQRAYCMIKAVHCQQGWGQENGNVTIDVGLGYKREMDQKEEEEEVISERMVESGVTEREQEKKWVKIFGVWVS